jgi:DNA mismatch endonuclease, patch repair protein
MPFENVPEVVRRRMSKIRKHNSRPELIVRRILRQLGYRYRLHRADLPGTPDLVFAGRRKVIFVHGCFWHQHDCSRGRKQPSSRREYWLPKLARNLQRDHQAQHALKEAGWQLMVVWECEIRDEPALTERLRTFFTVKSHEGPCRVVAARRDLS